MTTPSAGGGDGAGSRPLRVCYFGIYGPRSPRNAMLIKGLRTTGAEVVECRGPLELLPGHSRGPGVRGISWRRARYEGGEAVITARRIAHLARRAAEVRGPIDAVVVAEYNQGLTPLAALLAARHRAPLIVDFALSLWDTAVNDRRSLKPNRPRAIYRRALDVAALRLADRILVETPAMGDHLDALFGGAVDKMAVIQIGAPEWLFAPAPLPERGDRPLLCLYYGTWIPLHGVEHILAAARALRDDPRFRFVLVGRGQTRAEMEATYAADPSGNVEFQPFLPQEDLLALLRDSDLCFGIFGTSSKARSVVSNKVWQCLAMGRPVVTGDGPGARSALRDGEDALLVPHGDAEAIAAALRRLADDEQLARRLANGAARLVQLRYTSTGVGAALAGTVRAASANAEGPA